MKKFLAIFFTMALLLSSVIIAAFPASAADISVNYDDFLIENGEIVEYYGNESKLIVPSVDKDGKPVTKIADEAFMMCSEIEELYICEGIHEIGKSAFAKCLKLCTVSLPYTLEVAGAYAFSQTSLASLVIPGRLKVIPSAFISNSNPDNGGYDIQLTDVIISPGVEEVSSRAFDFYGETLVFPKSVKKIAGAAFNWLKKTVRFYILNPECELGEFSDEERDYFMPNTDAYYTFKKDANIPIGLIWNSGSPIKIYCVQDAPLRERIAQWCDDYHSLQVNVISIDPTTAQEKENWCKENGTTDFTEWKMSGADLSGGDDGGSSNLTLIIIIAAGVLVLAAAAVVIILVLKKKKPAAEEK